MTAFMRGQGVPGSLFGRFVVFCFLQISISFYFLFFRQILVVGFLQEKNHCDGIYLRTRWLRGCLSLEISVFFFGFRALITNCKVQI
jgi:hypothetical protein